MLGRSLFGHAKFSYLRCIVSLETASETLVKHFEDAGQVLAEVKKLQSKNIDDATKKELHSSK